MSVFNRNIFIFAVSAFSCFAISSEPENIENNKIPTVYSETKEELKDLEKNELETQKELSDMYKQAVDCTFIPDCDFPKG